MAATVTKTAPHVSTKTQYYTTKAQARSSIGPDERGLVVRFARGKGYYTGAPVGAPVRAKAPSSAFGLSAGALSQYGLTPAQLRQMVSAEVAAQVNPQKLALSQAQAATDKQYATEQSAIKNLTSNYADLLKGISPGVESTYGDAANSIADFAKGYSGAVQGQLDAAGQGEQGLLAAAGAPQAQVQASLGQLAAPTDALYGTGGAIPAGALAREGAAFTSAAKMLPGEAVGRGQQNALVLTGQQHADDQKYADSLRQLLATVPQLQSSAVSGILGDAAKQTQLNLEAQALGLKTQNQQFNQKLATHRENLATQKYNLEVANQKTSIAEFNAKQTSAEHKIDAKVSAGIGDGFAHNSQGDTIQGPDGKPIKFSATKAAGSKTSPSAVNSFLSKLVNYKTVRTSDGNGGSTSTRQKAGLSMSYMAAYRRLRNMGLDDVTARQDLNSVYNRGEQGRAWLTNDEQAALKAASKSYVGLKPYGQVGPTAQTVMVKGQKAGYLTRAQAVALREAGLLPAGEWNTLPNSTVSVYYILPTS